MKKQLFIVATLFVIASTSFAQFNLGTTMVDTTTVASGLHVPWEILWGPDDHIWYTERNGHIGRLNPATKQNQTLRTINDVDETSESGLLGMVLHPSFADTPHVFVVYTYFTNKLIEKIVRYTYTGSSLINDTIIFNNIPASGNHNGARLWISPDRKLFITTGDAQDDPSAQLNNKLSGKVLRMNLNGSVPNDNPIVGNYIWSKGHRNQQGWVISPNGTIYSSEHGPSNDDELNIIVKGANYGWPNVQGFCNSQLEQQFCADSNVTEPIKAWTPTLAVAGIDYYDNSSIPEWQNAILMVTLKESDFRVLKLNTAGDSVLTSTTYFNNLFGRLRDVCVSPAGDIYISTSNQDGRANSPFPLNTDDRLIRIANPNASNVNKSSATFGFKIYPNPASDSFNVQLNGSGIYTMELLNALGQTVMTKQLKGNYINPVSIEKLVPGVYLYKVYNQSDTDEIRTGKIRVN